MQYKQMKVRFKKLSPDAVIPRYAHNTDAGLDLTATSRTFNDDDIDNASVQDTLFGRDCALLVKDLRTGGDDGQD